MRARQETINKYFDLRNYRGRVDFDEVAGVFLESKATDDLSERVNDYSMRMRNGKADVTINYEFEFALAEEEAMNNAFELAKDYEVVIWLSPPGGVYTEGRINILQRFIDEDGEVELKGKAIAVKWTPEEMLELGYRLMDAECVSMGGFNQAEELRRQPMGVKIRDGEDKLIATARRLMPELEEIWNDLEKGNDLERKEIIKEDAKEAYRLSGGDNVLFEMLMLQMGHQLRDYDNHGSSWLAGGGVRGGVRYEGVVDLRIRRLGGVNIVDAVEKNGKLICPICGEEVEGRHRCGRCGVRISRKSD